MKKNFIPDAVCGAFITLFIYAAVSKLLDFPEFRIQVGKSPILTAYAPEAAVVTPLLEIGIAGMLAIRRMRLFALYASFSLMTVFTTYIYIILHFSDYIPCSCGGVLQNLSWQQHLIFNLIFFVLAIIAILMYPVNVSAGWPAMDDKTGIAENLLAE
ncbi:MAG TPA: MauE/DoxX family redox-associated membrane protein [Puia sp.]|nr:MauE/DoxX family redox-associated membrane protein [Puia sp.]